MPKSTRQAVIDTNNIASVKLQYMYLIHPLSMFYDKFQHRAIREKKPTTPKRCVFFFFFFFFFFFNLFGIQAFRCSLASSAAGVMARGESSVDPYVFVMQNGATHIGTGRGGGGGGGGACRHHVCEIVITKVA